MKKKKKNWAQRGWGATDGRRLGASLPPPGSANGGCIRLFAPKFWKCDRDFTSVICRSVNVDGVVGILRGGGGGGGGETS